MMTGHRKRWRVIGRHRWVAGALISESVSDDDTERRFTATIRGWRNWKIYQGTSMLGYLQVIIRIVRAICVQIDLEGEHCEAMMAVNEYSCDAAELEKRAEVFEHQAKMTQIIADLHAELEERAEIFEYPISESFANWPAIKSEPGEGY